MEPLGGLRDRRVLHHRQENFELPEIHDCRRLWDCIRPLSCAKQWAGLRPCRLQESDLQESDATLPLNEVRGNNAQIFSSPASRTARRRTVAVARTPDLQDRNQTC